MLPPASCRLGGQHQKGLLNILIGHKNLQNTFSPRTPISTLCIGANPFHNIGFVLRSPILTISGRAWTWRRGPTSPSRWTTTNIFAFKILVGQLNIIQVCNLHCNQRLVLLLNLLLGEYFQIVRFLIKHLISWTFSKISEKETHFARNVVLGRSVCLLAKGSRKAFIPQILKVLGFKKCLHSGKFAFAKAFRKSNLTLNSTKSFLQLVAFTTYHKE